MIQHNEKLEKELLSYIAPEDKIIPQRCLKKLIIKNGWYEYCRNLYPDISYPEDHPHFLREILYRIFNKIDDRPTCKICGEPIIFNAGFANYCSRKCSNADPEVLAKNKTNVSKTLKENYKKRGAEINKKRQETLSKKYNVEISSGSPFAIKDIQNKAKATIQERYGVDNIFKLKNHKWSVQEEQFKKAEKE